LAEHSVDLVNGTECSFNCSVLPESSTSVDIDDVLVNNSTCNQVNSTDSITGLSSPDEQILVTHTSIDNSFSTDNTGSWLLLKGLHIVHLNIHAWMESMCRPNSSGVSGHEPQEKN